MLTLDRRPYPQLQYIRDFMVNWIRIWVISSPVQTFMTIRQNVASDNRSSSLQESVVLWSLVQYIHRPNFSSIFFGEVAEGKPVNILRANGNNMRY